MSEKETTKTKKGSGLEPNVAALLAWLLAPITSVIFLVTDPDDQFIKFHAMQSLVYTVGVWVIYGIVATILSIVTLGFGLICIGPLAFILPVVNIFGAIKAYNGEEWSMPIVGDFVRQNLMK